MDRLVALWVLPPFGFLVTVLQLPELRYVIANYIVMSLLAIATAARLWAQPFGWQGFRLCLISVTLLASLACIEWGHHLAGRPTIDGLTGVRMIIYSSLYGELLIFVLYACYLTSLDRYEKMRHLRFAVQVISYFHAFFVAYWLLLYYEVLKAIPKTDLLHSNSLSYIALFALLVIYYHRDKIVFAPFLLGFFTATNVLIIFLNQTRGAMLGLGLVAGYELLRFWAGRQLRLSPGISAMMVAGVLIIGAFAQRDLGQIESWPGENGDSPLTAVLEAVERAYDANEAVVVPGAVKVSDEGAISAFSRLGSSYYSLLSFLNNPLTGIGQAQSYEINVLGSGVHSLHFLLLNATGIVGYALLLSALLAILVAQGRVVVSRHLVLMLLIFFGYVLVFINSMPAYFALIPTVLAIRYDSQLSQSRGAVSGRGCLQEGGNVG